MRKLPSLRAGAAVAMAEFNIRLSPPVTAGPPPVSPASGSTCDARKCPWWPYSNAKDFKANTALILVVLFCALICALVLNAVVRYLVLHFRERREQRREDDRKAETGVAAERAAEIPSLVYAEGMRLAGAETECIICLSDFAVGERIRVLDKCNHGFHLQCVQRWLASRSSCPTCRANCSNDDELPSSVP